MTRTPQRIEFLTCVLSTAIENGGHGWFHVRRYRWDTVPPYEAYAVIEPMDELGTLHQVTNDVIATGLRVIRNAVMRAPSTGATDNSPVLHNSRTGDRLFMSSAQRRSIMLADRTNGEDGDLDAIDALNIVECGLFGRVVYA